ncbi:MAG: T9SS type A sorting domain-containing protein [Chlorobi bacterium]|nr:T9SS type A sorting domain-containing protein [Chlorobiota bacterium]
MAHKRFYVIFLIAVVLASGIMHADSGELRLRPLPDVQTFSLSPRLHERIPHMQYAPGPRLQGASYTVFDSLFNAFSYYGSNQTCVIWEPQSGAFLTIKRGALPPSVQTSTDIGNNIFLMWTTDFGQSWVRRGPVLEGSRGVLAPNGAPRYPALAVLYGDTQIRDLDGSAIAYFAPVTNGSNWIGMATGYVPTLPGAGANNIFLDAYDDRTPEGNQYLHAYGTTVSTASFSPSADSIFAFGMYSLSPTPQGSAPSSQNNHIGVMKVNVLGVNQFTPMIPPSLRSTNFADPGSTTARTSSEVALDIDNERNLYAGVFGRFSSLVYNDTARATFAVAKSTDGGNTWGDLNILPMSVIETYASQYGADPASSGFTFSWAWNNNTNTRVTSAKDFAVLGQNRYSFAAQFMLVSNQQIAGVHYVEVYYENGQWGIRKIADASLFETHPQWLFDTGSELAPSQLGCELQLSRTADYSALLFKTLEAQVATVNGQDYITTDVVVARRSADSPLWDGLRNATQSTMLDRITWLPKVVPSNVSNVPLLTVQAASRTGTEWDYLWTNQFLLASSSQDPTPDEILRYRQYVTLSAFSYSTLPAWGSGSTVENRGAPMTLTVTPNPSGHVVTISIDAGATTDPGSVEIVDMLGRVVHRAEFELGQQYYTLDVSNLPSGIYQCRYHSAVLTATTSMQIVR